MGTKKFTKMHGLGNDFAVFDSREDTIQMEISDIKAISNRFTGVGCDQLIVIEPPHTAHSDIFMRIYNSNGSEVGACGNATRCVAAQIMDENKTNKCTIETLAGVLIAEKNQDGISVNMGQVKTEWHEIPLATKVNTLKLDLSIEMLSDPVCLNVGNPHTVFFVAEVTKIPLERLGPLIENHQMFPEKTNVEIVQVESTKILTVRVWERGAGITKACGTGACAAAAAAHLLKLTDRNIDVKLDGGTLSINWLENGDIIMSGPTAVSYRGYWEF